MPWKTIVHPKTPDVLKACQYIRDERKDPTFLFEELEDRIIITSPTRDVAYKRGSYFHQKYGSHYEVTRS